MKRFAWALFALLMIAYFFAETTKPINEGFFPWYLKKTADVSGAALLAVGYDDVEVVDKSLVGSRGSITVERGCDAVAPTALFLSAVLASPTAWLPKFPALIGGTLILMIVNVIRIITLFLTRVYWPKAFDVMHLDIWQAAFIFLAIFLWAGWASWVAKRNKRQAHAAT